MTNANGSRGEPLGLYPGLSTPRLYDECVRIFRTKHYSRRTEVAYLGWIRRYIEFHGGRHPLEMGVDEVNAFVSHLATAGNVASSTQNQALSAVLWLYRHVLDRPLDRVEGIVSAGRPERLPDVLTAQEVSTVLELMSGVPKLVCQLLYGTGVRLVEGLDLRVKDLDFAREELFVRSGKGDKDRVTMLPSSLVEPLRAHLFVVREQHAADLAAGLGRVPLPHALGRKYPNADREWVWQRVFPARSHYTDRQTGIRYRHHLHETVVQKEVRTAGQHAGIDKRVTPHVLRHSFATQLLLNGYDIRTVQELLGHDDVRTTMRYLHVLNRGGYGVRSPLDSLNGTTYPAREGFLKDRKNNREPRSPGESSDADDER